MIRVAIVDDQPIVRAGLREFLQCQPGLQVVAEGHNGSQAVELVKRCPLDVLLMDLCMPGRNGLHALPAIRALAPQLGVLILSGYPEAVYAPQLKRLGAAGFLHKNCQPDEIVQAIRGIAACRGDGARDAALQARWRPAAVSLANAAKPDNGSGPRVVSTTAPALGAARRGTR